MYASKYPSGGRLSYAEVRLAEIKLIFGSQRSTFAETLPFLRKESKAKITSIVHQLGLHLDQSGII